MIFSRNDLKLHILTGKMKLSNLESKFKIRYKYFNYKLTRVNDEFYKMYNIMTP